MTQVGLIYTDFEERMRGWQANDTDSADLHVLVKASDLRSNVV